jgi:tetratricopeptide (TPR) repeat protein
MKKIFTVLLTLAMNVALFANSDITSVIESGKLSEISGDYQEAIRLYKEAISMDSNNYDAHLYLGNVFHVKNDYANSLIYYNNAIKLDGSRAEAFFFRGNLQIDLGSVFGAVNDYTQAIVNNPNDMQYYMCRGFAYANMGDFYNAVNDYSIAIQINPEGSKSYYSMAKTQGVLENITMACTKITELKDEGYVRAEAVYMNFCLI